MGFFIGMAIGLIFCGVMFASAKNRAQFEGGIFAASIVGVVLIFSIIFGSILSFSGVIDAPKTPSNQAAEKTEQKDTIKWEESEWAQ